MRIIIFDYILSGHHMEYIHNIYENIQYDNNLYYFALPREDFNTIKNNYRWNNKSKNINFYFFDSFMVNFHIQKKEINRLIKIINPDKFFFIMLQPMYKIIPFILNKGIKVSGIHYYIYLYEWKNLSLLRKIRNITYYSFLTRNKNVSHVYILNDIVSTDLLNKLFKTNKFFYLVDPVQNLKKSNEIYYRNLKRNDTEKIIAHLGSLDISKGTLDIMHTLLSFDNKYHNNCHFVFAGKVNTKIKNQFYELVNQIEKKNINITVIDKYLTLDEMDSLLQITSLLLCPYKRTSQSSGIIGYAAQYKIPVFAYDKGLLAKLIKRNNLGLVSDNIIDAFDYIENGNATVSDRYYKTHTVEIFAKTILNGF